MNVKIVVVIVVVVVDYSLLTHSRGHILGHQVSQQLVDHVER